MSRVIARPQALLDGAPKPASLLDPHSDAFRYVQEQRVFDDGFPDFVHDVPILANPHALRGAGSVGSPRVEGRIMMSIPGESSQAISLRPRFLAMLHRSQASSGEVTTARYGFDVVKTEGLGLLRISRIVGGSDKTATVQTLGAVEVDITGDPQFYEPGILDDPGLPPTEDHAKKSELTQITAAGIDAMEWAFH